MLQCQERKNMGGEKFHIRKGVLTFSAESIEESLIPGEQAENSFVIYGPKGKAVNGYVLSSNPMVRLLTNEFAGARETIAYQVREGQEEIRGEFRILSDHGEYTIPYHFTQQSGMSQSSLGPVRSLMHYTNLARTNWKEAVALFYRKEFPTILEPSLLTMYRALSAREGNEHNVEEFLITAGKKEPVEFSADQKEISLELSWRDVEEQEAQILHKVLKIRRKGWGYTRVQVSVTGNFLAADCSVLDDGLFREGTAALTVAVDPMQLHGGRNFGSVVLTPEYGAAIVIPVTVSLGVHTALRTMHRREQHELIAKMMEEYLQLRGHQTDGKTFAERMGHLVRRLQESDRNNPMTTLYRIHYLLTIHEEQEAVWELQALNRRLSGLDSELPAFSIAQFDLEDDLTYSYRMYLTALCVDNPEAKAAAEEGGETTYGAAHDVIRSLARKQKQNPDNFWIAWLLLYADSGRMGRPRETARVLRRQYELGSRSPVLYMEYYQLMQEDSGTLYELGEFELQTLWFAAKRGILTGAVLVQLNYLALRRKTFSKQLFRILTKAYELDLPQIRQADLLESICTLLIRGNMTDTSCFVWYQRGVEAGLTITRLLDYYMMALPEGYSGELPQIVVRYYAYQNSLPWMQSAYLYRYVLEHREDFAEFYEQYAPQIDRFTLEQLMLHRISPDLAVLYTHYLTAGRVLTEEIASAAIPAAFSCRAKADAGEMAEHRLRRVVAVYEHFLPEQYFPLQGNTAFFPLYGEKCVTLLEDDNGNRYAGSVHLECERLMDYEQLSELLAMYSMDHLGFDLYRSEQGEKLWPVTESSKENYRRLAESPEIPEEYRESLRQKLLQYYCANGSAELADFLGGVSAEGLTTKTRCELLRSLAGVGLTQKAYDWLLEYGIDGVDGDVLLRIVTGILEEKRPTDDECLTEIAHEAFTRGSYNDEVLQYLAEFWDGTTKELGELRTAMKGFSLPTEGISRRMLIQMLFTGEYADGRTELIEECWKDGMDAELIADAMAQSSHWYFVLRKDMGEAQFRLIGEFGRKGVPLLDICRIAWLKNRSVQSGEISDQEMEITSLFLSDLLERKTVFPFFRQFVGVLPLLQAYADETLVEYRCSPEEEPPKRVLYHYAMEHGGVRDAYAAREMKEMYEGVYVTGFLLFFGEQMHYYITDDDAEKNIIESGTIGQDARTQTTGQDRFDAINEITMLAALGRDSEAISRLEKYSRKSYMVSRMFEGAEHAL